MRLHSRLSAREMQIAAAREMMVSGSGGPRTFSVSPFADRPPYSLRASAFSSGKFATWSANPVRAVVATRPCHASALARGSFRALHRGVFGRRCAKNSHCRWHPKKSCCCRRGKERAGAPVREPNPSRNASHLLPPFSRPRALASWIPFGSTAPPAARHTSWFCPTMWKSMLDIVSTRTHG